MGRLDSLRRNRKPHPSVQPLDGKIEIAHPRPPINLRPAPRYFENVDYTRSLVVPITHQLQGEYPGEDMRRNIKYRQQIPQVDFAVDTYREYIMGHAININSDDPAAKKYLEKFCEETEFFKRLRNMVDMTLLLGTGILVRNLARDGSYVSVEDFDTATIFRVERDKFGNTLKLIQRVENVDWITVSKEKGEAGYTIDDMKPFMFRENGRSFYGRSILSTLSHMQDSRGRFYYPLCEKMIAITDAYTATVENFVHGRTFIEAKGWSEKDKREFKSKYESYIPGDTMVLNDVPKIEQLKFESGVDMVPFIEEFNRAFAIGLAIPVDILRGDQASLASLSVVDGAFMRRIYAFQTTLARYVVNEVFHDILRRHPSGKWLSPKALERANVSIAFQTEIPIRLTPEQVATRVSLGIWTIDEARAYDRTKGADLFDDATIKKAQDEKDEDREMALAAAKSDESTTAESGQG